MIISFPLHGSKCDRAGGRVIIYYLIINVDPSAALLPYIATQISAKYPQTRAMIKKNCPMVNNNVACGAIIVERAGYGKLIINLQWP